MLKLGFIKTFVLIMMIIVAIALSMAAMSLFKILPYFNQTDAAETIKFVDGEPFSIIFVISDTDQNDKLIVQDANVAYVSLMDPLTIFVTPLNDDDNDLLTHPFASNAKIIKYIEQKQGINNSYYILVDQQFIENFNTIYEYHKNSAEGASGIDFCEILNTLTADDLNHLINDFELYGESDLSTDDLLVLWNQLQSKSDCLFKVPGS